MTILPSNTVPSSKMLSSYQSSHQTTASTTNNYYLGSEAEDPTSDSDTTSMKRIGLVGLLAFVVFFVCFNNRGLISSTTNEHADIFIGGETASYNDHDGEVLAAEAEALAEEAEDLAAEAEALSEKAEAITEEVQAVVLGGERVFLHISDTHADPYYDYRYFWKAAKKISRDPRLFGKDEPAAMCGKHSVTYDSIVNYWKETSDPGDTCPCGHFGANPPFSVLASLADSIAKQDPEFVLWGGDFVSHYEPGTNPDGDCRTAKNVAKATVSMLNVQFGIPKKKKPIEHLWVWGNNDVIPKYSSLAQEWLEEFGQHLVEEEWLTPEEYATTWVLGGFYRRNLGEGLCVINLNSNSWTVAQINEDHHQAQLKWLREEAFSRSDDGCNEFIINAHVPLGWLRTGKGHHYWSNLEAAVAGENSDEYRDVIDPHHKNIIAELYGHINKADIRLTTGTVDYNEDAVEQVSVDPLGDPIGDLDGNIGEDSKIVSFTVAGISRRGNNDPQFQRIILEPKDMLMKHGIQDIEVYSMKGSDCGEDSFTHAYSFRDLFKPDFDDGINVQSVEVFVENDKLQRERVEMHLALSSMPYTKDNLKDKKWIKKVREDKTGCELA